MPIDESQAALDATDTKIPLTVFTTRVDTIFGVSFVSVAPEAAVVDELLPHIPESHRQSVAEYITRVKAMGRDERAKGDTIQGVFTGLYAHHPLSDKKVGAVCVLDFDTQSSLGLTASPCNIRFLCTSPSMSFLSTAPA